MEYESEQAGDPDLIAEAKKQHEKEDLRRRRITAVTFGAITVVALVSLVYAFVQKGIADEMTILSYQKSIELTRCAEEARRAQKMAEHAMNESRRAQKQTEAALQKALKK